MQQKEKLQDKLDKLLGTDGVFLYPSHPRVAPKHHHPLFRPFDFAYTGQSSSSVKAHQSLLQLDSFVSLIFFPAYETTLSIVLYLQV